MAEAEAERKEEAGEAPGARAFVAGGEEDAHFRALVREVCGEDARVEVRSAGEGRGKGVFAVRGVAEGEAVFEERCWAGVQDNGDEVDACGHCMRVLSSLGEQLERAGLEPSPEVEAAAAAAVAAAGGVPERVPCERAGAGCDVTYCGEACRDEAWAQHHSWLCAGGAHKGDVAAQFLGVARNTNGTLVLAARVIARTLSDAARRGCTVREASRPLRYICRAPWWDVSSGGADDVAGAMRELVADACQFLRALMAGRAREEARERGGDGGADGLFEERHVAELMGMFEQNNWSTVAPGPLGDAAEEVDDEGVQEAAAQCGDATGTGLYALGSAVNHSCEPNAALLKRPGVRDSTTAVLALRDIAPGEEVTISYIDESAPLEERRADLADYQFVCRCARCVAEEEEEE